MRHPITIIKIVGLKFISHNRDWNAVGVSREDETHFSFPLCNILETRIEKLYPYCPGVVAPAFELAST